MKLRLSIYMFMLFAFGAAKAQTLEEAKQHIYYQRYETAKNTLQSVIKKGANSPDVWYWLGEIYLKQKKLDSAREVFLNGTNYFLSNNLSKKSYPLVFIGWAHMLLDTGAVTDAKNQMEEILKLTKYKDPTALLAIAKANIQSKNGDVAWALELLEKAAKRDKKNPEIYVAMGDAYRKQINGTKAVISYDEALSINPNYAEAYFKKGLIYKSQNNTEIFIDRFSKAVAADSMYAPALYELYYHYFYRDSKKAGALLSRYIKNSDPSIEHSYMMTDYLYSTAKYQQAITSSQNIIAIQGKDTKPRLYKLIAYSQAKLGDSVSAEKNMTQYFLIQPPKECVAKDYELMAKLTETNYMDKTKSLEWYKKALNLESDQKDKISYMISLADIQKELGNREREAVWRENIYNTKQRPTNLDIYNWGIALYMAEDYIKADSVFGMYSSKYPDQVYGHLWQARCNAVIDSTMEKGLAVPHYIKLIDVASADAEKNKTTILKAYGYLGTYEANIKKDFSASLSYFEKLLELDPDNSDAQKYIAVLKKWIENTGSSEANTNN